MCVCNVSVLRLNAAMKLQIMLVFRMRVATKCSCFVLDRVQIDSWKGRATPLTVLFYSLTVLDPRVDHAMDVLSLFISILCHSD